MLIKRTKWFFSFKLVYFDLQNPNLMSNFVDRDWKSPKIQKRKIFSRFIENIRYGSKWFPCGWLAMAAMGFTSFYAACNRLYRASQRFDLVNKNLTNPLLFGAGGNNTFKLISNCSEELEFLNYILKLSIIRKLSFFPDYCFFSRLLFQNIHFGCF